MLSVAATYVFTMVLPYIKIGEVGLNLHPRKKNVGYHYMMFWGPCSYPLACGILMCRYVQVVYRKLQHFNKLFLLLGKS